MMHDVKTHKRGKGVVIAHKRKGGTSSMMKPGIDGLMARLAKNPALKGLMSNPAVAMKMKSMAGKLMGHAEEKE